jgi:hypothetical protein
VRTNISFCVHRLSSHRFVPAEMKRAELGLLEVLGLLVRMLGVKVMSRLPCFAGEQDSSLFSF